MGYLADSYRDLNPTKTDMYQLTMAQGYFDQGRQQEEATFYMHWRNPPFGGGYTVAAGLEGVVDFLKNFHFSEEQIAHLRTIQRKGKPLFSEAFLDYLKNTTLQLDVDAVPEGTAMTSQGPVIRVRGPLLQAQLVESAILNIVNASSMVATRAARLSDAANNRPIADFSLRRAATLDTSVARASYIGGISAVADVDAARRLGIPCTGTMAHAWIMGFRAAIDGYVEARKNGRGATWVSPYYESPDRLFYEKLVRNTVDEVWPNVTNSEIELVAFKAYLHSMPTNSVLLVDTFDPIQGVKNAIRAAKEMGVELDGVRLDSGDLFTLCFETDALLTHARLQDPELFANTKIYATDGLDEEKITMLQARALAEKGRELPIDVYGVGTELGNPGPLRGGVYKVSANEIVHEDFEAKLDTKSGSTETRMVHGSRVAIQRGMVGTMKVAGVNHTDPSIPGPKSSMPGEMLDIVRLSDDSGKQVADVIVNAASPSENVCARILQEGAVDASGRDIDVSGATQAETLLKPVFRRRMSMASEYVYEEPARKAAYINGPEVTNLDVIKHFALQQRAQLPEEIRRIENPMAQPIIMDRRVFNERKMIMSSMLPEVPGHSIAGEFITQQPHKHIEH